MHSIVGYGRKAALASFGVFTNAILPSSVIVGVIIVEHRLYTDNIFEIIRTYYSRFQGPAFTFR